MMIRPIALAAALLFSAPAAAQQATPQENLDCAVWADFMIGEALDEQDDSASTSLTFALVWFIGQYEGQTGEVIDTAMAARATELDVAAKERLTVTCFSRVESFADRLSNLGEQLSKSAE
jgi:hypothetical protein